MTGSATESPHVGKPLTYVDEYGKSHSAIVTADWSYTRQENDGPLPEYASLNLVYVVDDKSMTDSCGRQIARATSVVHQSKQQAHGRYWK